MAPCGITIGLFNSILEAWEMLNPSGVELDAVAPIDCRSHLQMKHVSALSARDPRLQSRRSIYQHHLVLLYGDILKMGLQFRLAHLLLMEIVTCPSCLLVRHL